MQAINTNDLCLETKNSKLMAKTKTKQFCLRMLEKVGQQMNLSVWVNFK